MESLVLINMQIKTIMSYYIFIGMAERRENPVIINTGVYVCVCVCVCVSLELCIGVVGMKWLNHFGKQFGGFL